MRTFVLGLLAFALLAGGITGGWAGIDRFSAGDAGTPAHAAAISNGHPEDCTNVNFHVKQRALGVRTVMLDENDIVRGTFEVNGGLGHVDIRLRVITPRGLELFASPRAENYDFMFPVTLRGAYQFVFDNRYSMFTPKAVGLFYCVDTGTRPPGG